MIKGVSIERRVVRAFVGLMALAAVLYAIFMMLIAYTIEDEIIDRIVNDEVRYLQQGYANTGQLPAPRLDFIDVYASAADAPRAVQDKLTEHPDRREIFTRDERHFHVRYLPLDDRNQPLLVAEVSTLLVVTNMSAGLLALLATVLGLIVGAAIWLAYRIARQTTRPIIQLSDEVQRRQLTDGELRLSAAGQTGEVGYLADVIQSSFNQLRGALEREHHFTRDVSHELRTPLTVVRNALSTLGERPAEPADIELLNQATGHMHATITALLGLAREESQQRHTVKLRPIVEDSILTLNKSLDQLDFQVEVSLPDDVEVDGNAHLISLLVTNLIENAVRYAAKPHLTIAWHGQALRFSNAVAAPVTGDLTSPHHKAAYSPGLGQGLFLVKRIAETLQWRLSTSTEGPIFSVTLQLPLAPETPGISP